MDAQYDTPERGHHYKQPIHLQVIIWSLVNIKVLIIAALNQSWQSRNNRLNILPC